MKRDNVETRYDGWALYIYIYICYICRKPIERITRERFDELQRDLFFLDRTVKIKIRARVREENARDDTD